MEIRNTLLEKLDLLQSRCSIFRLKYVDVLHTFKNVVNDIFSCDLKLTFKESIKFFKNAYLLSGLSITPKVHAVFYHVPEYCDMSQTGLEYWG